LGFTISKANATITVTPYTSAGTTYDGNSHTAAGTATGVKGEALSGLDLSDTAHTNAGIYSSDYWTFTDSTGNYNSVAQTPLPDSIARANAAVAASGYSGGTYDGNAHTQTVTVTGVGNAQLYTTSLTATNAGSYSLPWSFSSNPNYNAVSGTLA